MKHFTSLLLATIVAAFTTLAQAATPPAAEGTEHIVPTYKLYVDRGYLPNTGNYVVTEDQAGTYAFIEVPGVDGKYLYCIDNDKFIRTDNFNLANPFRDNPNGTFIITKIEGSERYTIASQASGNYFQAGGSKQLCIDSWKTLDAGNQWTFQEVGTFDASDLCADKVTLNKTEIALCNGMTETLTATLPRLLSDRTVTWTSSDETVATVSTTGVVSFVSLGTATITATAAIGATAQCVVTCKKVNPESITLNKTATTIKTGLTETLTPTFLPEISDNTLTWTSSDETVATVSETGVVTAINPGIATITATTVNGLTATCEVTVIPQPAESITLSTNSLPLYVGGTKALSATILPENTYDKSVTWSSSDDDIATVSADGTVTANSSGTAIITATTTNGLTAQATVSVIADEGTIVPTYKLYVDRGYLPNTGDYVVTEDQAGTYAFIEVPGVDGKYLYCIDNDKFIRTDDFNGYNAFRDNPNGTFIITKIEGCERYTIASQASGNYFQAGGSKQLCIDSWKTLGAGNQWTFQEVGSFDASYLYADKVTLNKTEIALCDGMTETLTATLPRLVSDRPITWTSSDETVATVSTTGVVSFVGLGTATITATAANGATAQCVVTCKKVNPESITLNKTATTIITGLTETLTPTFLPEISDHTLTWTSSDETIATVSETGVVTAVNLGIATITATTVNGLTATCEVTVIPQPAESITLSTNSFALYVGGTKALSATILPENTYDKSVTWSSSDDDIATVTADGTVTANSIGTAIITATTTNGLTAQATVSVIADEGTILPTYKLYVDRGYLPNTGNYVVTEGQAGTYAFIEVPGVDGKYLYCIDNDKFIRTDYFNLNNPFLDNPNGTFIITKIEGSERYTIASQASGNYFQAGGSKQLCIDSWKYLDEGNQWTFQEVGSFDATAIISKIHGITTPVGATKAKTTLQDIHTLTGIRRKNLGKGVNIVNGRKVIIN